MIVTPENARDVDLQNSPIRLLDNILSIAEKPVHISNRDFIISEETRLNALAIKYSIVTEKAVFNTAVSNLTLYLSTLTYPTLWSNLSDITTLGVDPGNASAGRAKFDAMFVAVNSTMLDLELKINTIQGVTSSLTVNSFPLVSSSLGVIASYAGANTTMTVLVGNIDDSANWTFTRSNSNVTSSNIGNIITISGLTADSGYVDITATKTGYPSQVLRYSVYKAASGANGAFVSISTTNQAFTRADNNATFSPATITLTATGYNGTITAYQWQYWTGSAWANVATSGTASTYSVPHGDFTDARTYRVQATINASNYFDELTIVELTGGTNAVVGFLTNEAVTMSATPDGTVTGIVAATTGTFKVYEGTVDKTGLTGPVTYSVFSSTNCTFSVATSGVYSASAMTDDSASVVLRAVYSGVTIDKIVSLAKSRAGAAGTSGTPGAPADKNAIAYLYQWSVSQPGNPSSSSTFTWATAASSSYLGTNGWQANPPSNPGTPLAQLWVTAKAVIDTAAAITTSISWASGFSVYANGANGSSGVAGAQYGSAKVYKWAATIPTAPVGAPTFTWSSQSFGAAPTDWYLTPSADPSYTTALYSLWVAEVKLSDIGTSNTTAFNWSASSIYSLSTNGANGVNGTNGTAGGPGPAGAEGARYVAAYCASATGATATTPANTTGATSVPATNDGGISGTWSKTVPSLSEGQYMYQSDGIYNPITNTVTWSIPYWSSLKVGNLSAISANLGTITAGSLNIGSGVFTVSAAGAVTASNLSLTGGLIGSTPIATVTAGASLGTSALQPGGTLTGAVAGTASIGGTLASIVVSNASTGGSAATTAGTALTNAATAQSTADGKVSKTAASILTGEVTLSSAGGIKIGTPTWNASGVATAGTGVIITANGIAGISGGVSKFAITSSGDATFSGNITGATGTFSGDLNTSGVITGTGSNATGIPGAVTASIVGDASGSGSGVVGRSASGVAIFGRCNGGSTGVMGISDGGGGGVYGSAGGINTVNNYNNGVEGYSVYGCGVAGKTAAGYGIYGSASGNGYSGYFAGKVGLSGVSALELSGSTGTSGQTLVSSGSISTPTWGPRMLAGIGSTDANGDLAITLTAGTGSWALSAMSDGVNISVNLQSISGNTWTMRAYTANTGAARSGAGIRWIAITY